MDRQASLPLTEIRASSPRRMMALSCIDNRDDMLGQRRKNTAGKISQSYPSLPVTIASAVNPDDHAIRPETNENVPPSSEYVPKLSIIQQKFTTSLDDRVQPLRQRPSVGGKTVSTAKQARRRKRLSPDQLRQLSRRIDPTELTTVNQSPSKPALPSLNALRKRPHNLLDETLIDSVLPHAPLFKTCHDIWPSSQSLGELSHDSIQNLSEMLKVRLSQAKFRVLATLESAGDTSQEPTASATTADDNLLWSTLLPTRVVLSPKRHKSSSALACVGNGKNLFRRKHESFHRLVHRDLDLTMDVSERPRKRLALGPHHRKSKSAQSPRARSRTSAISPITLDDGSRVFICEPCGKRYKNRNGLTYHLSRCKYQPDESEEDEEEDEEEDATIQCICDRPSEDKGTMVQCDECHVWLHTDCVIEGDESLEDVYHCPRCVDTAATPQQDILPVIHRGSRSLMHDLQEAQQSDDHDENDPPSHPIMFNIFSDMSTPVREPRLENTALTPAATPQNTGITQWDDFHLSPGAANQTPVAEPWSQLSEDEPFHSLSNAAPWSDLLRPPSLLFSDNTLSSTLDDDLLGSTPADTSATPLPSDVLLPSDLSTDADAFFFLDYDNNTF